MDTFLGKHNTLGKQNIGRRSKNFDWAYIKLETEFVI